MLASCTPGLLNFESRGYGGVMTQSVLFFAPLGTLASDEIMQLAGVCRCVCNAELESHRLWRPSLLLSCGVDPADRRRLSAKDGVLFFALTGTPWRVFLCSQTGKQTRGTYMLCLRTVAPTPRGGCSCAGRRSFSDDASACARADTETDGRTGGRTDRQTDRQASRQARRTDLGRQEMRIFLSPLSPPLSSPT